MLLMKEPHTALFVVPTRVRKTHLALNLLENEYKNHLDFIITICPTLKHNETYRSLKRFGLIPNLSQQSQAIIYTIELKR